MPGMNRKGPQGGGPQTGGGRGICRRTGDGTTQSQGTGQGRGLGTGQGRGRGMGRGRGLGQRQGNQGSGMGRSAAGQGSMPENIPGGNAPAKTPAGQDKVDDNQKILDNLMTRAQRLEMDENREK
jgi:hypothetical protein